MAHLLLNTLALDPNRWTPEKIAYYPLDALLMPIAEAGFHGVELWQYHVSREREAGVRRLRAQAEALGLEELIDPEATLHVVDDHTPFVVSGVEEVLAVIDFQFGARRTPGPYWHTVRDNTSAVSAESLNSVGRLVVQTVVRIEKRLLQRAPAP